MCLPCVAATAWLGSRERSPSLSTASRPRVSGGVARPRPSASRPARPVSALEESSGGLREASRGYIFSVFSLKKKLTETEKKRELGRSRPIDGINPLIV